MNDDAKPNVISVDFAKEPEGPAIFAFFRRQGLRRRADLRRQRRKGLTLRCGDPLATRLKIVRSPER